MTLKDTFVLLQTYEPSPPPPSPLLKFTFHKMKEDSRLHACIVCASVSCPNLRRGAYTAEVTLFIHHRKDRLLFADSPSSSPLKNLDAEMTESVNDFWNNTKKGMYVDRDKKTVKLSNIFNW